MVSTLKIALPEIVDHVFKPFMYSFRTSVKPKHISALLGYGSIIKAINLVKVELSILLRLRKCLGYPYLLTVEPTNACNLRCPICLTGKGLVGRPIQNMSFEGFRRLIDETGKYLYVVNLYNWGEPLLNRDVFKMIAYCHEKGIYTSVSTNGNYDPQVNDELLSSGLDNIVFALDGSNKEVYEKYRVGGSFEKVVGNICDLLEKRGRSSSRKPFVEIQFLVFEHNKGDVENMKKLSGELGVDSLLVRSGFVPDGRRLEGYYTWDSGRDFCRRFWYCAIVNCDGGVVPCCRFFYKKDDFGNAFSDGFSSVWNNKLYQSVREAVAKGEVNSLPKVCRDCRKYVGRK